MSVLKLGWTSNSNSLTVFTAVIKLSACADDFVKQSAKQFWVEMWARSWILPEQASFRKMAIIWIVCFCTGKRINCCCCGHQVHRVSPHVKFCNLTWHVHPQSTEELSWTKTIQEWIQFCHGRWEYGSLNLLTFVVNKTSIWHSILRGMLSQFCKKKHCHASPWRPIFIVSVGGIKKSNYSSQRSCGWPEVKFHWLQLELPHQLVKSFYITNCWRCCTWSTSGKLVTTLELCPAL